MASHSEIFEAVYASGQDFILLTYINAYPSEIAETNLLSISKWTTRLARPHWYL
jgi:hypothetical protein